MSPLLSGSRAGVRRARFHELEVAEVERLTENAVAVRFTIPSELAAEYRFTAGQYVTLRITRETPSGAIPVLRSYSISRSPRRAAEDGLLEIAAARVEGGVMSTWLQEIGPGERVSVLTPTGSFGCRSDGRDGRHHVAITAGSGITPVMAILDTVLTEEPGSRFTLIQGNRSLQSVMFRERISALAAEYPDRLRIVHVLSRHADGVVPRDGAHVHGAPVSRRPVARRAATWPSTELPSDEGRSDEEQSEEWRPGRLDARGIGIVLGDVLGQAAEGTAFADIDEWYVCGRVQVVDTVRAYLEGRVAPEHLHHEAFYAADDPRR